ncbi:MAG: hypothetical protein IJ728_00675, partial [Selenomonadaceae bacterium]|nr:hypothetical protein [Selenomonadaceae bacterium]
GDIDTSEEHRKDVKLVMDRAWYASGWWLGQMIDKYDAHTPYKLGKLRRACLNGDINYFSDSEKWNVKSYIEKKTEIKFEIQRFAEEADEVEEVKTAEKPLEYVNKTGDSVMAIRLINISKRGHVCRVYEISISTYGGEYTKQEGLGKGFKRHFENLEEAKRTIKKAAVRYGYVKAEIEENPTFDPQMIKLLDEYERITYEKAKARNKRNLEGLERAVKLGHERSGIYDQLLENNDYQKNHVVTLFAEIDKRVKRAERSADDEEAE